MLRIISVIKRLYRIYSFDKQENLRGKNGIEAIHYGE